jgi:hypothetical protein
MSLPAFRSFDSHHRDRRFPWRPAHSEASTPEKKLVCRDCGFPRQIDPLFRGALTRLPWRGTKTKIEISANAADQREKKKAGQSDAEIKNRFISRPPGTNESEIADSAMSLEPSSL